MRSVPRSNRPHSPRGWSVLVGLSEVTLISGDRLVCGSPYLSERGGPAASEAAVGPLTFWCRVITHSPGRYDMKSLPTTRKLNIYKNAYALIGNIKQTLAHVSESKHSGCLITLLPQLSQFKLLAVHYQSKRVFKITWMYIFTYIYVVLSPAFSLLQFLCLKNIRTFLKVCHDKFGLRNSELFDPFDLFDVRDFGKVSSMFHAETDVLLFTCWNAVHGEKTVQPKGNVLSTAGA